MHMLRLCSTILLGFTPVACDALLDRSEPASRERTPKGAASFEGEPGDSIPCETDVDCPRSACGPCTPGQVFTRANFRVDCGMDPCAGAGSVCSEEHFCVVGPATRKNPHAWCRACVDLEAESKSMCAHEREAVEVTACETAIARVVEACDEAACEAARGSKVGGR
jgi:hypothetical protein